jgi:hypothetical protein
MPPASSSTGDVAEDEHQADHPVLDVVDRRGREHRHAFMFGSRQQHDLVRALRVFGGHRHQQREVERPAGLPVDGVEHALHGLAQRVFDGPAGQLARRVAE